MELEQAELAVIRSRERLERLRLIQSRAAREHEEAAIDSSSLTDGPVNHRRCHEDTGRTNSAVIGVPVPPVVRFSDQQRTSGNRRDLSLVPTSTDSERIATRLQKQSGISSSDRWIDQPLTSTMGHQTQSLPQLKLEPFDGDNAKWPDFAAGFKARVHDVALSDCQRMAYLRSYLTHSVRSSIPQDFSDPSQYFEGL